MLLFRCATGEAWNVIHHELSMLTTAKDVLDCEMYFVGSDKNKYFEEQLNRGGKQFACGTEYAYP